MIINRAEMKIYDGETYIYHGRAPVVIDFSIDICQAMHCNSKKFALKLNQK